MTYGKFFVAALAMAPATAAGAQQVADTAFDVSVAQPAHVGRHPRVALDEAHNNFHTIAGRYGPWARLMRNDGLEVVPLAQRFSAATLAGLDVLVIANPAAPGVGAGGLTSPPAFTGAECDAVREWVRGGGSLLLVSDHAPFGSASEILARRFGVRFGKGFVYDALHHLGERGTTQLVFEGALLGAHPIMNGRDSTEHVRTVYSFTGQSMTIPGGATALLVLSPTAGEAPTRADLARGRGVPVGGRAQGIAMTFGKGRVVMLGEAAMLSAQLAAGANRAFNAPFTMGMNHPGSDDKQFALNVMRWLTGVLK